MTGVQTWCSSDLAQFVNYAAQKKVKNISPKLTIQAAGYLQNQLKAFMAKAKWKMNGYYLVTSSQDPVMQKALQVLNGSAR